MILSDNARGALLMSASMAAFTLNDACMKAVSPVLSLPQALLMRGALTTVLILGLAVALGQWRWRMTRADGWRVLLRAAAEVATAWFFITALFHMPLANATAILQSLPLAVTLAGAVFLGESVGWRRMSAIGVGFIGVLMIVQPGAEGFTVYSLYALIAVGMVTLRDLTTRRISAQAPSLLVAAVSSAAVTLFGAVGMAGTPWAPVDGRVLALVGAMSVAILGAYLFSIMAMRVGDLAVSAPFRYTGILWALLLGLVIFGEWPNALTLMGAAVVVVSGVYTFARERRLAQR